MEISVPAKLLDKDIQAEEEIKILNLRPENDPIYKDIRNLNVKQVIR